MLSKAKSNSRPRIRFKQFSSNWESRKLSELTQIYDGTHQTPVYVGEGVPFYSVEQLTSDNFQDTKYVSEKAFKNEAKNKAIEQDDLLMTRIGDIGTIKHINWMPKAAFYVSLALIKKSSKFQSNFLSQAMRTSWFQRQLWNRTLHVAFPKKINLGDIGSCSLRLPTQDEQTKIGNFLSQVDSLIKNLKIQQINLKKYRKGVLQNIFFQKIRFKDKNGKAYQQWASKPLKEIFSKVNRRNKDDAIFDVLTNSAIKGVISQGDFFEKDIANQDNLTNYFVVDIDDFVYNPRISKFAPVGPFNRNKVKKGVMSPLYTVLKVKEGIRDYLEYYFSSSLWHHYMCKIANYGARHDRMSFSQEDFMNMPIPFPCTDEQEKISSFLSSLDELIANKEKQIKLLEQWKKGLLQQMFV